MITVEEIDSTLASIAAADDDSYLQCKRTEDECIKFLNMLGFSTEEYKIYGIAALRVTKFFLNKEKVKTVYIKLQNKAFW